MSERFRVDLLFYHFRLRRFVVVELKAVPFSPAFVGQMNLYLSAVDDLMRHPDDAPTISLLLCKDKDRLVVEYALRDLDKPSASRTGRPAWWRFCRTISRAAWRPSKRSRRSSREPTGMEAEVWTLRGPEIVSVAGNVASWCSAGSNDSRETVRLHASTMRPDLYQAAKEDRVSFSHVSCNLASCGVAFAGEAAQLEVSKDTTVYRLVGTKGLAAYLMRRLRGLRLSEMDEWAQNIGGYMPPRHRSSRSESISRDDPRNG